MYLAVFAFCSDMNGYILFGLLVNYSCVYFVFCVCFLFLCFVLFFVVCSCFLYWFLYFGFVFVLCFFVVAALCVGSLVISCFCSCSFFLHGVFSSLRAFLIGDLLPRFSTFTPQKTGKPEIFPEFFQI